MFSLAHHCRRSCKTETSLIWSEYESDTSCLRKVDVHNSLCCRCGKSTSCTDPALDAFAARLLPKSRRLAALPMRLPNWMARFTRAAARESPRSRSASRRMILSPTPAEGKAHTLITTVGLMLHSMHLAKLTCNCSLCM